MDLDEVAQEKSCNHEPNQLYPIDSEYDEDDVIYLFRCRCGKAVVKHFQLIGTEIMD